MIEDQYETASSPTGWPCMRRESYISKIVFFSGQFTIAGNKITCATDEFYQFNVKPECNPGKHTAKPQRLILVNCDDAEQN